MLLKECLEPAVRNSLELAEVCVFVIVLPLIGFAPVCGAIKWKALLHFVYTQLAGDAGSLIVAKPQTAGFHQPFVARLDQFDHGKDFEVDDCWGNCGWLIRCLLKLIRNDKHGVGRRDDVLDSHLLCEPRGGFTGRRGLFRRHVRVVDEDELQFDPQFQLIVDVVWVTLSVAKNALVLRQSHIGDIAEMRDHCVHERSDDGSHLRRFDVGESQFWQHETRELDFEKRTKRVTKFIKLFDCNAGFGSQAAPARSDLEEDLEAKAGVRL